MEVSVLVQTLLIFKHLILLPTTLLKIAFLIQMVNCLTEGLIIIVQTLEYDMLTNNLVKLHVYIS